MSNFLSLPDVSDKYLRDVFMNLLVAGRDTTSQTLHWLMYHLATNPEVQERLYEEIKEKVGEAEPVWKEHTDGALPYLVAVIKETLRMSPPVPSDPKQASKSTVLPGTKTRISKGTIFDWCQQTSSFNEMLFYEPKKFKPGKQQRKKKKGRKERNVFDKH